MAMLGVKGKDLTLQIARANDCYSFLNQKSSIHLLKRANEKERISHDLEAEEYLKLIRNKSSHRLFTIMGHRSVVVGFVQFSKLASGWGWDFFPMTETYRHLEDSCIELALKQFVQDNNPCGAIDRTFQLKKPDRDTNSNPKKGLKIVVCSNTNSWFGSSSASIIIWLVKSGNVVEWKSDVQSLFEPCDVRLFLSLEQIVPKSILKTARTNIVVHASDLPRGRGWSPATWDILHGKRRLTVSLIEAAEAVDSGDIYFQDIIDLKGDELIDEWRSSVAQSTIRLIKDFITEFPTILDKGKPQVGQPTYFMKRNAEHSQLELDKSIGEQFNLLRVVDNQNYPSFFILKGVKYFLRISSAENDKGT